jgi:hypothetical protein
MTASTLAIDVGGVLYYDEPFDLAWLQGVWEFAQEGDTATTHLEHPRPASFRPTARRAGGASVNAGPRSSSPSLEPSTP